MNKIYLGYTKEEIQIIAELMRLQDMFEGDLLFRETALNNPAELSDVYGKLNMTMDQQDLMPVWENARKIFLAGRENISVNWSPIEKLVLAHKKKYGDYLLSYEASNSESKSRRLNIWRQRQIKRARSETGMPKNIRFFPLFGYELSKGCTVNCWFCAFSAGKYQGYSPHNEKNAALWREILDTGLELFGDLARQALCYHATEPFDNPDYFRFMEDFLNINNALPQTTTAVPLRNPEMTRQMIEMRETSPDIHDRFSVTAADDLRKIFKEFSPIELINVELVHHSPGGLANKAYAGKTLKLKNKPNDINRVVREHYKIEGTIEQQTIECLVGFLVNLVDRSIKLVIPCIACDQWPKGYRIIKEGVFCNIEEYRNFLEESVEECMAEELGWDMPALFRKDLKYEKTGEGFTLTSYSTRHKLQGQSWHAAMGDMIAGGDMTRGEITTRLAASGASPVQVTSSLQNLFSNGLIEE